ncbi:LysR family regulatory protein [Salmonella enterica subsp. enterica serovar Daytona]|uniref:LysR family regulatory protein n=1 Tax=Salmonella enterica subsp. enterica serovar Daytona TaxID=1962639 RepID=A0A447JQ01_SALET|nr:LysR family regulatory protein [Salmonella enterica subsp. enterica serovar Daytona]
MDIRTLRYFVEVVRQQSFTRAAEKLFVTQPTISKMLKNLEDELNCTLLIRDGRKLLLTDTGRVVFERGLAILAEFRQLEAELSDINHLNKGLAAAGYSPDGRHVDGRANQFVSTTLPWALNSKFRSLAA